MEKAREKMRGTERREADRGGGKGEKKGDKGFGKCQLTRTPSSGRRVKWHKIHELCRQMQEWNHRPLYMSVMVYAHAHSMPPVYGSQALFRSF